MTNTIPKYQLEYLEQLVSLGNLEQSTLDAMIAKKRNSKASNANRTINGEIVSNAEYMRERRLLLKAEKESGYEVRLIQPVGRPVTKYFKVKIENSK